MSVIVDLITDESGRPAVTRVDEDNTTAEQVEYLTWPKQYLDVRVWSSCALSPTNRKFLDTL